MQRPKRTTRKCIFCGANANSKEHFWPQWIHSHIVEHNPDEKHDRKLLSYHPLTGQRISGPSGRTGGIHTIRIRAVCSPCNNGWMNRIEEAARPALTRVANAEQCVLHAQDLEAIARWVALKTIVVEHNAPNLTVTPQADRARLMTEGKIPDFFRVYMALNVSKHRIGFVRHTHSIWMPKMGPIQSPEGADQNIQTITFLAGRVVFHVNADRVPGFDFESTSLVLPVWHECRIWPPSRDHMAWPRKPALGEQGLETLAGCLERLVRTPKLPWHSAGAERPTT